MRPELERGPKLMRNSDPSEPKVVTCPARGEEFRHFDREIVNFRGFGAQSGFHIFDQKEPPSRVWPQNHLLLPHALYDVLSYFVM